MIFHVPTLYINYWSTAVFPQIFSGQRRPTVSLLNADGKVFVADGQCMTHNFTFNSVTMSLREKWTNHDHNKRKRKISSPFKRWCWLNFKWWWSTINTVTEISFLFVIFFVWFTFILFNSHLFIISLSSFNNIF